MQFTAHHTYLHGKGNLRGRKWRYCRWTQVTYGRIRSWTVSAIPHLASVRNVSHNHSWHLRRCACGGQESAFCSIRRRELAKTAPETSSRNMRRKCGRRKKCCTDESCWLLTGNRTHIRVKHEPQNNKRGIFEERRPGSHTTKQQFPQAQNMGASKILHYSSRNNMPGICSIFHPTEPFARHHPNKP